MRVECSSCGKGIQIPPEKVPNRPFAFACPKCQNRIKVEPPGSTPPPTTEVSLSEVESAVSEAGSPAPQADEIGDETRPVFGNAPPSAVPEVGETQGPAATASPAPVAKPLPLKPNEQRLLASIMPVAFVVELGAPTGPDLDADLQAFGMQDIRRFNDLDEAVEQLLETDIGILVISVPKAKAPPFDLLEPLGRIPARTRRRVFVILEAANVTSLDGQVAFFLQVNCLINSGEADRRRNHMQRALLYHLKLYQHWELDAT